MKFYGVTIRMKASEQYLPVVLFRGYYMAARRYEISLIYTRRRNFVSPSGHVMFFLLNQRQWTTKPFHFLVFWCVRRDLFCSRGNGDIFKCEDTCVTCFNIFTWEVFARKLTWYFIGVSIIFMPYKVVLTFESVDKILWDDHSLESYIDQKIPVVLFICCTICFLLMNLWMKSYGVTIQMKATQQYFPVVLFIMLYKLVLTFKSLDEILWCDHSNQSYWAVLSCGTVHYAVQGDSYISWFFCQVYGVTIQLIKALN